MKLHTGGYLTFFLPGRSSPLELRVAAPVALHELLTQAGIPLGEVAVAVLNGAMVELYSAQVCDTDEVRVLSAVDGG